MIKNLSEYKFNTPIQLRWKDIDQFNHVNNAVYLTYFETARYYYCKEVNNWNWDIDKFVIASMKIDYLRPLYYPNDILVYLKVCNIDKKKFEFKYAITYNDKGREKIAALGSSLQVMFDLEAKKTIDIPERLINDWNLFENR